MKCFLWYVLLYFNKRIFWFYNLEGRILFRVVRQRQPGYVAKIGTVRSVYGEAFTSDLQKGVRGYH
jgi:hypothetical protein